MNFNLDREFQQCEIGLLHVKSTNKRTQGGPSILNKKAGIIVDGGSGGMSEQQSAFKKNNKKAKKSVKIVIEGDYEV